MTLDGGPGTILIVDDEETNRAIYRKIFSEAGYNAFTAGTRDETFDRLASTLTDIVLLDVMLGSENGLDILKEIKNDPKYNYVTVVIITGMLTSSEQQAAGLDMGADGYLVRSIERRELVARIDAFMRHKRTLDALARSEARFRKIIIRLPDAILIVDSEGKIRFSNPAAEDLFKLTIDELLGRLFGYPVISGEHTEIQILRQGDGQASAEMRTIDIDWEEEPSLLTSIRDISERKIAEEERLLLQAHLAQAQKMESLGTLVAGVGHNFNNLLAVIMFTASNRLGLAKEPEDAKAYQIIEKACKRGREVVRSMMQFARTSIPQSVPLDLHALIAELCNLLEAANHSRIHIVQESFPGPLWVTGSEGILSSAIMNLCINALDALPKGGTLTIRTTVPEQGWVGIQVEDNGTGMTPEILAKVMDPFFTTKEPGKGTGLGLSMAYGVIKAHEGTMQIASEPGQGTTVTLRLPRIPAPVEPAVETPQAPALENLNILLVDDDEDVRILAAMTLKAGGLKASFAEGGKEALEYLDTHEPPDLIILDQTMPGMDGVETMEAIRALHPDLPILISSGRMDIEDWDCFKRPNVAILSKPFDLAELKAKLTKMDLKPKGKP